MLAKTLKSCGSQPLGEPRPPAISPARAKGWQYVSHVNEASAVTTAMIRKPRVDMILTMLPPELLAIVGAAANPNDWLALKISCRTFNAVMPGQLQDILTGLTKEQVMSVIPVVETHPTHWESPREIEEIVAQAMCRIESSNAKRSSLPRLTCTKCCSRKDRSQFVDSVVSQLRYEPPEDDQIVTDPPCMKRLCVGCVVKDGSKPYDYSRRKFFVVGGKRCWVCFHCGDAPAFPRLDSLVGGGYVKWSYNDHEYSMGMRKLPRNKPDPKLCRPCDTYLKRIRDYE